MCVREKNGSRTFFCARRDFLTPVKCNILFSITLGEIFSTFFSLSICVRVYSTWSKVNDDRENCDSLSLFLAPLPRVVRQRILNRLLYYMSEFMCTCASVRLGDIYTKTRAGKDQVKYLHVCVCMCSYARLTRASCLVVFAIKL